MTHNQPVLHKILQRIGMSLPMRLIDHEGRSYLRRYHVGTVFGIRCYLHHFVDSDPAGLHNHPWRYGLTILLSGHYWEERRFCRIPNPRIVKWINFVGGDYLHRVLLGRDGAGNTLTTWSLFFHSRKVMSWGTLHDKGVFTQYLEEKAEHNQTDGHSDWWKTAPKGRDLLHPDGTEKGLPQLLLDIPFTDADARRILSPK